MQRKLDVWVIAAVVATLAMYGLGVNLWAAFAIAAIFLAVVTLVVDE